MADGGEGEIRWMTYQALAEALDMKLTSARRLAFRRRWARQPGNDGLARVAVPAVALQREMQVATNGATNDTSTDITIHALEPTSREATVMADIMATLLADRRTAESRAAGLSNTIAELQDRLASRDAELTQCIGELDRLREALAGAEREAAAGRQGAAEARQEAAQARERAITAESRAAEAQAALARLKGRGWVARLLNRE